MTTALPDAERMWTWLRQIILDDFIQGVTGDEECQETIAAVIEELEMLGFSELVDEPFRWLVKDVSVNAPAWRSAYSENTIGDLREAAEDFLRHGALAAAEADTRIEIRYA